METDTNRPFALRPEIDSQLISEEAGVQSDRASSPFGAALLDSFVCEVQPKYGVLCCNGQEGLPICSVLHGEIALYFSSVSIQIVLQNIRPIRIRNFLNPIVEASATTT